MITSLLLVASAGMQTVAEPAIIPQPVSMQMEQGNFELSAHTSLQVGDGCGDPASMLRQEVGPGTGFSFPERNYSKSEIALSIDHNLPHGPESYTLTVTPSAVRIVGGSAAGVFYGIQTLRQMLPASTFRKAPMESGPYAIPCLKIEDYPRFGWRGAHLDCGRHFMPAGFVMRYIDLMAMHKLNTFHWHLTEDQGWRIQIKKYPNLTNHGAWRARSMINYDKQTFDPRPHGGYYTQEDVKEVVAYAKQRFVTVVPEIEMPGHSQAAVSSYPELGNTGKEVPVDDSWGVSENTLNMKDSTLKFMQNVILEVMNLFPSKYIHLGGDEAPTVQWKNSPDAQAKMKELGITDPRGLQTWFTHQMDAFLTAHGRHLIGWDEILEGGKLAPGAVVMSWRGEQGGITAASEGHDVVMAPGEYTYLDHGQSRDTQLEALNIGGLLTLHQIYDYNPIPKSMPEKYAKHVLGAQCQIWTEYVPDSKHVEYLAFPRLSAFSEVVWSPEGTLNYDHFMSRLQVHLKRLDALDVNYRRLDPPRPILSTWQVDAKQGQDTPADFSLTTDQIGERKLIRIGVWNMGGSKGAVTVTSLEVNGQAVDLKDLKIDSSDDSSNVISFPVPEGNNGPISVHITLSGLKDGKVNGEFILLPDPNLYHPFAQGSA